MAWIGSFFLAAYLFSFDKDVFEFYTSRSRHLRLGWELWTTATHLREPFLRFMTNGQCLKLRASGYNYAAYRRSSFGGEEVGGEKVGRYVRKNEPLRRLTLPRIRSQGPKRKFEYWYPYFGLRYRSDADSDVLADYVLALIRSDAPNDEIRKASVENLEDFLRER